MSTIKEFFIDALTSGGSARANDTFNLAQTQERARFRRIGARRQVVAPDISETGMKSAKARHRIVSDLDVRDIQGRAAQRMPGICLPKSIDFHVPYSEIPSLTAGLYQR